MDTSTILTASKTMSKKLPSHVEQARDAQHYPQEYQARLNGVEKPHFELWPKQSILYHSPASEILFGGAAGGSKSHGLRAVGCIWCFQIPGLEVFLTRRLIPDLKKNHMTGNWSFPKMLAPWIKAGLVKENKQDMVYTFPNGSYIQLMGLQHEAEIEDHARGLEIHVLLNDEATLLTEFQYRYLKTRMRMPKELQDYIIENFPQYSYEIRDPATGRMVRKCSFPKIINATNPMGSSHDMFKREFWDNRKAFKLYQTYVKYDGKRRPSFLRQFIPSHLQDNPALDFDSYAANIVAVNSPEHARALLEGDWSVNLAGMFSDLFSYKRHVIETDTVLIPPPHWKKWNALDWGSTEPFAELYFTESNGIDEFGGVIYPRGTIIVYYELYGIQHDHNGDYIANKGMKLSPTEVGQWANNVEEHHGIENIYWRFSDTKLFEDQRIRAAQYTRAMEFLEQTGRVYIKAKQGKNSRELGWEKLRSLLKHGKEEYPGILFCSYLKHTIRTFTALQRDPKKPNDTDSKCEDHAPDALRYGCTPLYTGHHLPSPEEIEQEKKIKEEELIQSVLNEREDPLNFRKKKRKDEFVG